MSEASALLRRCCWWQVLRLYRQAQRFVRRLPFKASRTKHVYNVREMFELHRNEDDPQRVDSLLQRGACAFGGPLSSACLALVPGDATPGNPRRPTCVQAGPRWMPSHRCCS